MNEALGAANSADVVFQQWQKQAVVGAAAIRHNGPCEPQEACRSDNDCSSHSNACTGNKGNAIPTPVFGLIGAGMGALLPASGWQEGSLSLELAEAGFALRLPSAHASRTAKRRARRASRAAGSLRVTFILLLVVLILFVTLLFFLFVAWIFANEDTGGEPGITFGCELFWICSTHPQ